ncbi:MAG TPA: bacillithiol transferase BstA [Clostridia bacterium]|nr:bacillithiol transferase BstA [Clostridia bacterium]
MSTHPTTDARYPIGKFTWAGPNTESDRKCYIDQIEQAPVQLRAAVFGLTDQQLDTPYREGGWTVRQVVHHVADSHMNAYIRFKLALTENEPTVKPYDEKAWAEQPDSKLPVEVSLQLFDRLHQRFTTILRSMKPADFDRKLRHPELGEVVLDRYVAMYAWHGKHHVAHITELRNRMGW